MRKELEGKCKRERDIHSPKRNAGDEEKGGNSSAKRKNQKQNGKVLSLEFCGVGGDGWRATQTLKVRAAIL